MKLFQQFINTTVLFPTFAMATSAQDTLPHALRSYFKKPHRYVEFKVGITPVGVGAYYATRLEEGKLFEIVLGQRVGSTKAMTLITAKMGRPGVECVGTTYVDGNYHNMGRIVWEEKKGSYYLNSTEGNSQFWLDPLLLGRPNEMPNPLTKDVDVATIFPLKPAQDRKYLFPCTDMKEGIASPPSAQDSSPTLAQANIPWLQKKNLEVISISKDSFISRLESLKVAPPDWHVALGASSLKTTLQDLRLLTERCENDVKSFEQDILSALAPSPYPIIRKIHQIGALCRKINSLYNTLESASISKHLNDLAVAELTLSDTWYQKFNAGPNELLKPISIPEHAAPVLLKYVGAFLNEVNDLVALEKARKFPITLRLGLTDFKRGGTLLGAVTLQTKDVSTSLEVASAEEQVNKGWLVAPPPELEQFSYANGLSYARGDVANGAIASACRNGKGYVGLDLVGYDSGVVVDAEWYRGEWGPQAQVSTTYQFLLETFLHTTCKHVIIRLPKQDAVGPLTQLLENFHQTYLQTTRTFQISNGGFKKMRLLPGQYEIVLRSSLDNRTVWKSEIVVEKPDVFNIGNSLSRISSKMRVKKKG